MRTRRCMCGLCLVLAAIGVQAAEPPKPKDGPLGMKFVPLPKGTFYMGWDGRKGSARKTEIKENFEIAAHEVTQGQWQELLGNNPSWFSRQGEWKEKVKDIKDEDLKQFPVEGVSWNDAQDFLKKLNEKEMGKGYLYRLPTDAEWEYACRGAATTEEKCSHRFYVEKPTNDLSSKQANFDGSLPAGKGEKGPVVARPTKVGTYAPNNLGLYDMHGNVWEMTDTVPDGNSDRRLRGGGGFHSFGLDCQAAFRLTSAPTDRYSDLGFRVARVLVR